MRIAIYAIFALSLELIVGATGLVSLGHAAFLGIGAYATVLASGDGGASLLVLRAARGRRGRGLCARRRRAQPAHARRLLHHGHARLRADGVLRRPRHPGRRRQRRHLPVRQADARASAARRSLDLGQRAALLLRRARRAGRRPTPSSRCCSRSRFGHALAGIRVNEQRMRAAGFSTYAVQARRLRHRRRARRSGRLAARGQGRRRQPRAARLARVGRGAADADPRRHRQPARRGASARSRSRC